MTYKVNAEIIGNRLDKAITLFMPDISRAFASLLIETLIALIRIPHQNLTRDPRPLSAFEFQLN